jgi:ADP-heptose:LPS heptosyltransferase
VLHALPALAALREALPARVRIDWAVEDRAAPLLVGRPEIDRVVVFPRGDLSLSRGAGTGARGLARFLGALRREPYDAALDLQGNLKSGAVTRASGARWRYGFARGAAREGNTLFTQRRHRPGDDVQHRVERGLSLASAFVGRPLAWRDPGFLLTTGERDEALGLLAGVACPDSGFVVLHPGTSGFGAF